MTLITFHVPGLPQPQGSAKAYVRGRHAVVTSDNARLRPWRAAVTDAAADARGETPTLRTAVFVGLVFTFPRPASHYGKRGIRGSAPAFPATRPDIDKLCRATLDSLAESGLIADDSLVVELQASKDYGEHPGVDVTVGEA